MTLEELHENKVELIRRLQACFYQISGLQQPDDWTEEDSDLWDRCILHSAVRKRLQDRIDAERNGGDDS